MKNAIILTVATCVLALGQAPKTPVPQAAPAAKAWDKLVYPKLGEIHLPPIQRFTLPNGMKLFLVEDHSLPIVDGTAMVRTGARWVDPGKIGLAGIFGQVMRTGGTKSRTGDQLDEDLEAIAASVETNVGQSAASVSFSAQSSDLDKVLATFADVLMNPEFRQDKIDLAKVQTRSAIQRRNDDASGIASREFPKLIYGADSPYAQQSEVWTVDAITRADLTAFYNRYYHPNNIMLGIRGDFDAAAMKAKIEKAFANWPSAKLNLPPVPQADPSLRPSLNLVKKDDVNQSSIRIGHIDGRYDDPNYFATSVMAEVLCSNEFASRITRHIRSEMGLAYAASGSWSAEYDHDGVFSIYIGTKSESTVKAIEAAIKEIREIREKEISDDELKIAKESILNSFVFNFEDAGQVMRRVMTYEYYGYPADFLESYKTNVEKVTKADVLRVAQRRLQPGSLAILVVGNDKAFDKPMDKIEYAGGRVNTIDVTIHDKKPGPGGARPLPPPTAGAIEAAKPVLARAQKFAGGVDKLKSIKDMDVKGKAKATTPGGKFELEAHNTMIFPATQRTELVMNPLLILTFSDGTNGWQQNPGGTGDMTEAQKRDAREQMFHQLPNLLSLAGNPTVSLARKDGDNDVLLFTLGEASVFVTVDPAGKVVKRNYRGTTPVGPGEIEEALSDYHDVDGVQVPFKMVTSLNGQTYLEVQFAEVKMNTGASAAKLAEKPK